MRLREVGKFLTAALMLALGCSSAPKQEDGVVPHPQPPIAPPYVHVPHPFKHDMADVQAIFHSKQAPSMDSLKVCDETVEKLREKTVSTEEFRIGVQELVRQDPIGYHWCFYGKILELEKILKEDTFVDEKQKHVLGTYSFLVPVAKGYLAEFHDTRYLRWAISYYTKLSEWVFYRRVETGPAMTQELVEASDAFHEWRGQSAEGQSVLEKYNLVPPGKYEGQVKFDTKAAKVETLAPADGAPAKTPEEVPLTFVSDPSAAAPTPVPSPSAAPVVKAPTPEASSAPASDAPPAPQPVASAAPVPAPVSSSVPVERAPAATAPASPPAVEPAAPAVAPPAPPAPDPATPSMPTAPMQKGP